MTRIPRVLAIAAIGVLAAGCGGDDTKGTDHASKTAKRLLAHAPSGQPKTTVSIDVVDGKPKGGVASWQTRLDAYVEFSVSSDAADEVHVHGYDIPKDVEAGTVTTFAFKADAPGVFEVELEDAGVKLGDLVVNP